MSRQRNSQNGAALLVCLVLLLGLTVVGVAGMKETVTQQKVVNAIIEDDTAFQAAEFALREGERFIRDYTRAGNVLSAGKHTHNNKTVEVEDERENEIGSVKDINDHADSWWKKSDVDIWDLGATVDSYPLVNSGQTAPSFYIEILNDSGSVQTEDDRNRVFNYRVTARGYGVNSSYYVVLQSTYAVQM